jgi:hypothetical protein
MLAESPLEKLVALAGTRPARFKFYLQWKQRGGPPFPVRLTIHRLAQLFPSYPASQDRGPPFRAEVCRIASSPCTRLVRPIRASPPRLPDRSATRGRVAYSVRAGFPPGGFPGRNPSCGIELSCREQRQCRNRGLIGAAVPGRPSLQDAPPGVTDGLDLARVGAGTFPIILRSEVWTTRSILHLCS